MAQLVRFDPNHDDLIADMEFDIYGNRLCTVSSDHTIKVWQRCTGANTSGQWQLMSSWKGHDSSLTKVSWAHPEFGNLIATGSFDRTVRIWQQRRQEAAYHGTGVGTSGTAAAAPAAAAPSHISAAAGGADTNPAALRFGADTPAGRSGLQSNSLLEAAAMVGGMVSDASVNAWHMITAKKDAQGMIVDLAFAPHFMGLQLAAASSDGVVRIYETGSPVKFDTWSLLSEIDVNGSPILAPYLEERLHPHTAAGNDDPTPGGGLGSDHGGPSHPPSHVAAGSGNVPLTAEQNLLAQSNAFQEVGNNLCISWCPTRFLTNTMAVGCGREKDAKIYRFAGGRWVVYEVLEGHTDIVHSISWAPQVGRSYHLVATACRDTYVRIYRVDTSYSSDIVSGDSNDLVEEYEAAAPGLQLNATLVASFNDHGAEVWSVSWNVTGTILSSSGDDGKVRLWKATSTGEWREIETISTEQDTD
ncbi:epoxide hydrolase, soluble (sEH) [Dimargaris cristalligena]|nr:epoxide hydrolase, soluble (sEH) [Dimargaris cristalligena]